MSYHGDGVIRCDVCGKEDLAPASPRSDGHELVGWERIYSDNRLGIPAHTCSPGCFDTGKAFLRDNAERIEQQEKLARARRDQRRALDRAREEFRRVSERYFVDAAQLSDDATVETRMGTFAVDLLIDVHGQRIAVVFAGSKDLRDDYLDEWTDAMIVGFGNVGTVFRFLGADVAEETESCMGVMRHVAPYLFSERGKLNLDTLAGPEAIDEWERFAKDRSVKRFGDAECEVRTRSQLSGSRPAFWKTYVDFAAQLPTGSLSEIMAAWKSRPSTFFGSDS